jgi:hypothetical protein
MAVLAPPGKPTVEDWAFWRWLATSDERILWSILAAAALLAVLGMWTGWRRR